MSCGFLPMFCERGTTLSHYGSQDFYTPNDDVVPHFQVRKTHVDEEVT